MTEAFLNEIDYSDIDAFLNQIFGYSGTRFEDLVDCAMNGDFAALCDSLGKYVYDIFFDNLIQCRNLFLGIFFVGLLAILLNGVSDLFTDGKIALFSSYFIFLFVSLILLKCFMNTYDTCAVNLDEMTRFCGMLMPAFCLVLGIASGPITATAYYELQLFMAFVIENIMTLIVMPMIRVICVLHALNRLPDANRFDGIITLLKKSVIFLTRSALFASIGSSMLQAGIMPAIDGVNSKLVLKTVSLLPGLGDYAGSITETVLRGVVLVKNSIGIAGIFILILMCFKPAIVTLMYGAIVKLASAILQISGEKKFTDHVWKMADCFFLLSRVQLFSGGMFFISICVATLGMQVQP